MARRLQTRRFSGREPRCSPATEAGRYGCAALNATSLTGSGRAAHTAAAVTERLHVTRSSSRRTTWRTRQKEDRHWNKSRCRKLHRGYIMLEVCVSLSSHSRDGRTTQVSLKIVQIDSQDVNILVCRGLIVCLYCYLTVVNLQVHPCLWIVSLPTSCFLSPKAWPTSRLPRSYITYCTHCSVCTRGFSKCPSSTTRGPKYFCCVT